MLISFSIENFRSIRDLQTLSMEARKGDHKEWSHVAEVGHNRLLKTAAIYGANASGKSNILKALFWFRQFIANSTNLGSPGTGIEPFLLDTFSANKPTHFEAVFFWKAIEYRYGFELTSKTVVSEWLYQKGTTGRESRLFTREGSEFDINSTLFKEGKGLEARVRDDALFLTVCAQFNGKKALEILQWVQQVRLISGLSDMSYYNFTAKQLQESRARNQIVEFARTADFNVRDISSTEEELTGMAIDQLPSHIAEAVKADPPTNRTIYTTRDVRNESGVVVGKHQSELDDEESEGTRKFICLAGPLLHTLETGSILIVDELEARLHPRLTQAIVDLFHSGANRKDAQLIFATHDVTLMDPDRFRREEINFCEKGEDGATRLYSLADFDSEQVRPTSKFSRQYLQGIFGAVPHLNHFRSAVGDATFQK